MFSKSKTYASNYLAAIVQLTNIRKHCNADRLQISSVFNNNIITGLTAEVGQLYCYFPIECAISKEFLSSTNSYSDATLNKDTTVKGYFPSSGRVKVAKLRGEKSEGYIVPLSSLADFVKNVLKEDFIFDDSMIGVEFDTIGTHQLCRKYIPVNQRGAGLPNGRKTKGSIKKHMSKLVENQFRLHYDTSPLKKNSHKVHPDDYIAISNKLHGTSFVVANVLIKKKLNLFQRVFKKLGADVVDTEYGMLYSSRCVIKNRDYVTVDDTMGFYGSDIWKIAADKIEPFLKAGVSVYGEIVGFTESGAYIQKGFDYNCAPNTCAIYIYRMTYTSATGDVFEFSHHQVAEWCKSHGFDMVPEYYHGKARDLFPDLSVDSMDLETWQDQFLQRLMAHYLEKDCDMCVNPVPAEGVCLRLDAKSDFEVYKLKSFKFFLMESSALDKNEIDIETEQSQIFEE